MILLADCRRGVSYAFTLQEGNKTVIYNTRSFRLSDGKHGLALSSSVELTGDSKA